VFNAYLRVFVKDLPDTTVDHLINWLNGQDWNVHPRNGEVDFLCQHYDPDKALLTNTRDKLAALGIIEYELDDPFA
jgi:hypothetical protein